MMEARGQRQIDGVADETVRPAPAPHPGLSVGKNRRRAGSAVLEPGGDTDEGLARTHLDDALVRQVTTVLQASIDYAWANRDETLSTMRRYAQELDDDVILAHVDLYVNERTRDLGDEGARALEELSRRAVAAGLVPPGLPGLEIR